MEAKTNNIKYFINGNCKEFSDKITLEKVLFGCNEFKEGSIIILNGIYIDSQEKYESIQISDGDKIEVVNFLAGG